VRLHDISQDSGIVRINLVPLIIFGNGRLSESPWTTNFVGKWRTQMHKKASFAQIKCFSNFLFLELNGVGCQTFGSLNVFMKSMTHGKNAHKHSLCSF
jgi:hypothetical protein